jgi:hypothetical protein
MPNIEARYCRLLALNRRHITDGQTKVVGQVEWGSARRTVFFSDAHWPLSSLRLFLGLEIAVVHDIERKCVTPAPLDLQTDAMCRSAVVYASTGDDWLASLPCISDKVVERPTGQPKRRRFIVNQVFIDKIRRDARLEDVQRAMNHLIKDKKGLDFAWSGVGPGDPLFD